MDKVRVDIVGSGNSSFHAVGDGNAASRGTGEVSLVNDSRAHGIFELLELFGLDELLFKRDGFGKATVVIRVSAPAAGDAGDTLSRVVEHGAELTVSSSNTGGGVLHDEPLEGVSVQAHVVAIDVGDRLDFFVGNPHHVGGRRNLVEVL